jgi:hypothetical protein
MLPREKGEIEGERRYSRDTGDCRCKPKRTRHRAKTTLEILYGNSTSSLSIFSV